MHNEYVQSMLEYASGKLILTIEPSELLIALNWKPFRIIPALFKSNIEKYFLLPHPEFDENKFPFLVCSGFDYYSLVNIKDFRIEKFIDQPCYFIRSQQAFFF